MNVQTKALPLNSATVGKVNFEVKLNALVFDFVRHLNQPIF